MQSLNALHSSLEISKEMNSEIYYVYFDFFRKPLYNAQIDNDIETNAKFISMLCHFISGMKNVMTINIHNYICFLLSKYLVMPIDDEVSKFGLGINFMVL